MPWTSEHTKWLVDTGERLKTTDGKDVEAWEFQHQMTTRCSPHGRNTSEITIALTPKSIIGAEGTFDNMAMALHYHMFQRAGAGSAPAFILT